MLSQERSSAGRMRFNDRVICDYLTGLTNNLGRYSHEPNKHYEIAVVDLPHANAFTAGGAADST